MGHPVPIFKVRNICREHRCGKYCSKISQPALSPPLPQSNSSASVHTKLQCTITSMLHSPQCTLLTLSLSTGHTGTLVKDGMRSWLDLPPFPLQFPNVALSSSTPLCDTIQPSTLGPMQPKLWGWAVVQQRSGHEQCLPNKSASKTNISLTINERKLVLNGFGSDKYIEQFLSTMVSIGKLVLLCLPNLLYICNLQHCQG